MELTFTFFIKCYATSMQMTVLTIPVHIWSQDVYRDEESG